jgi:hypothetical protein
MASWQKILVLVRAIVFLSLHHASACGRKSWLVGLPCSSLADERLSWREEKMRYGTTKPLGIGCIILVILILFGAFALVPQPVRGQTVTVPVGTDPWDVAITPNGEYAYVTNLEGNTVSVLNIGALTASVIPSSAAIDMGQTTLFTAMAFGGSSSYTTYQWYVNGSAQSGQTASTFTFVPAFAGSYLITATVTDSSGATSTQSNAAKITVNVLPTVSIAPVGPLSLPVGQVQQFTATTSGGSGTIDYQWYLDGSAVGTNSASYFYISAAGSHTITCTVTDSAPTPVTSPASNAVSITGLSGASGALTIDNSWMEKAHIPSATSGDEAAVLNGTIYIFGPTDYAYNPITDTLTTIAPMLTPRDSFAVAACGNKIYVIGGYSEITGASFSVNEAYDPATNTWATEASMPTNISEMAADTVNGEIYVVGGRAANTYSTSTVEIYNPATNSWSTGASMPYPVASAASAVVGNNIYVIGGEDDSHPPPGSQNVPGVNSVNFNQIYNPATNTWSLGTPIPTSTLAPGAGATTGVDAPERIYVFGNIVGFGVSSNQNYAYDPVTNSWQSGAPMPYACSSPAVAVVSDLLFVMGDGQNVEQYTPIGYMSRTTVTAATNGGKTISLTLVGNVTSSQMSNVTITTDRSAATTTVSFIVTGLSGTAGFSNITISMSAVPYGSTPTVYIDNQTAPNQGYTQDANNYYVWYTTQFSTHQISIVFNTPSSSSSSLKHPPTLFPTATVAAVSGASAAIIVGAVLSVYYKKRKKTVSTL